LKERLSVHIENAVKGELLRNGISLSLVGAPNVGKSSLLNRIAGREAVIVSPEAGTTRDVVDLAIDLDGYMVVLADTAGLRVGDRGDRVQKVGMIEQEGIRRARRRALDSHVVVAVVEIETGNDGRIGVQLPKDVIDVINEAEDSGKQVVVAVNKTDLLASSSAESIPMDIIRQLNSALPSIPEERIFGVFL
jgi:tRNA modification GTPase